jgi:uncharacterized protein YkwD
MTMRRLAALICSVVLVASLAGCGTGDSDNTLTTGLTTGNTRPINNANINPPPTPQVALQDGSQTAMTQRELAFASEVFRLLNEYRVQVLGAGNELLWNPQVAGVADGHTAQMQTTGVITHDGPPPCAQPQVCPALRLTTAGIVWSAVRENVARGQRTAQEVIDAWKASPGHNANMLSLDVTMVGIAFREAPSPVNGFPYWWTQHFMAP